MNRISMEGLTFGRLTVVEYANSLGRYKLAKWRCVCSCGGERVVTGTNLRRGMVLSCGCLRSEKSRERAAVRRAAAEQRKIADD